MSPVWARSQRCHRLLWALISASMLLRLWFAWGFLGFVTGDDVEVLETGFRTALGLDYQPWEIRNLLMPELVVRPALEAAHLLGVASPGHLVRAALLPFVLLGSLGTWLVFRLGSRWTGDDRVGLLAATIYACHPLFLAYTSTALPRVPAATLILAAALLVSGSGRDVLRGIGAGSLVALAFACRYSEMTFLMPLALVAWLAAERGAGRWRRLVGLAAGFGLGTVLATGLFDLLTWGRPFASLVEFARYTLVERQASAEVAAQPLFWYLRRLPRWLPLSLLPLLWYVPRRRATASAWAFVVLPLLVLSCIQHKDLRYLQTLVPFVALLAAMGGVELLDRGWRQTVAALVALALAYGLWTGYGHLDRRSLAAAAAAERLAGEPGVHTVVLSQAWAWGDRLFLGNDVGVRGLPIKVTPAELEAALEGADRVGLYAEALVANPELDGVLLGRGLARLETVERGGSKAVALYGRRLEAQPVLEAEDAVVPVVVGERQAVAHVERAGAAAAYPRSELEIDDRVAVGLHDVGARPRIGQRYRWNGESVQDIPADELADRTDAEAFSAALVAGSDAKAENVAGVVVVADHRVGPTGRLDPADRGARVRRPGERIR